MDLIDQLDLDKRFDDINKSKQNLISLFKKTSIKFPPLNTNPSVSTFLKQNIKDICKLPRKKNTPLNLTFEENKALESWSRL